MIQPIEVPPSADLVYAAERAYVAYGNRVEWKAVNGDNMRRWADLDEVIRHAWMLATSTVFAYARMIHEGKLTRSPHISDQVHYVSRGSADGHYLAMCRAATITQVLTAAYLGSYKIDPEQAMTVGLFVMNPEGTYHLTLEGAGGCKYALARPGHQLTGGTWHWADDCLAP